MAPILATANHAVRGCFLAIALATVAAGCLEGGGDATVDAGTAADTCSTADACAQADTGAQPVDGCPAGLDADGDGVCDRLHADWNVDAQFPASGDRRDIYRLGPALDEVAERGLGHALVWPVDVSGVLLPWRPLATMLDPETTDRSTLTVQQLTRDALGFGTTDEMYAWLGLARADGAPHAWGSVAWPDDVTEGTPLGAGIIETDAGEALTFSCATCHTAELFGRTVVGLTNRMARANEFFHLASEFFPSLTAEMFEGITGATDDEVRQFVRTQQNLVAIGTKPPQVLGLDTSLAQVSLSLARRGLDPYAEMPEPGTVAARPNLLDDFVADSKPAVWWTLKYKTRWLADGSIVAGNPIFTNFLWNELGRGTDLRELETWLRENQRVVDELTVAVFATEAPRWVDFFGADSIDVGAAQRGQELFLATCARCHGVYEKGWDAPDAAERSLADRIATTFVDYPNPTPVYDVGTDPQRAEGMSAFAERLNELAISQAMETVVEVQDGYVPPPLDGIWARYPYLHNQSVPTLCDLLTPSSERTEVFWMGPSRDPETDFDASCVGYPRGESVPEAWKTDEHARFDTSAPGLTNAGHDEWLLGSTDEPLLSEAERADLIEFLKTL